MIEIISKKYKKTVDKYIDMCYYISVERKETKNKPRK